LHKKVQKNGKKKDKKSKKVHMVSGMYGYVPVQTSRSFLKALAKSNAEAFYDIDPFMDQWFPQGQMREDGTQFKIQAAACSTYTDYSNLAGKSAKRVCWREPLVYKNVVTGAEKLDQRGSLVDVEEVTITFRNMTHGTLKVKGNMPKCTFEDPNLIASRPNPFAFDLQAEQSRVIVMHIGNKVLKYRQLEFNLPDPASPTFKQRWMALFDMIVVIPNIDEFDGAPYEATKEMLSVDVHIRYITTMAQISNSDADPATSQIINAQSLGLQEMGEDFNTFHLDPVLVTETVAMKGLSINDIPEKIDEWVVVNPSGHPRGGQRLGNYRPVGAKSVFTTLDKVFGVVERVVGIVSLVAGFI